MEAAKPAKKKVDYRKRARALAWALRRARNRVTDGFGSGPEAREEWAWFAANVPDLAAHTDSIAWMRAYRAAPHWPAIHARCGKGLNTIANIRARIEARKAV